MITLRLQLRYGGTARRETLAWLIPGASPQQWLEELLRWNVPLTELALYVVPKAVGHASNVPPYVGWDSVPTEPGSGRSPNLRNHGTLETCPAGVFVIAPRDCRPRVSPRSQPYGLASGGLYVPVDADLDPEVSPSELAFLLGSEDRVYVFHSAAGLVGFDPADRLAIHDLLAPPRRLDIAWDGAQPGIAVPDRLFSMEPERVPNFESLLDDGQDDIATQLPSLEDLPPVPHEPSPGLLQRLGRGVQRQLARSVCWLTGWASRARRLLPDPDEKCARRGSPDPAETAGRQVSKNRETSGRDSGSVGRPATTPRRPATGPGSAATGFGAWVGKAAAAIAAAGIGGVAAVGIWAQRRLSRLDESLVRMRNREILRLLDLLSKDPDRGLRFAIPLHSGAHRAGGPPGARLPERKVDFSLGRVGSASPADFWNLLPDMRQQLLTKYMEAANRELRLGRHRRAAYIYGELLGRLDLAASALTAGRFWREAAELFLRRLNRPDEAARCLERGGLWSEAIGLYEKTGQFEKAGDLCQRIDQPIRAAEFYRLAVTGHVTSGDLISAARVLADKLDAPDEALQRLESGWPNSPQARGCVETMFHLLGRLGRHGDAKARVEAMRSQAFSHDRAVTLVGLLADLAQGYPADGVRATAADVTRTLAAASLPSATQDETRRLLAAISRLVPSDRLLSRDCQRFPQLRAEKSPAKPILPVPVATVVPQPKRSPLRPTLLHEFVLSCPSPVNWRSVVATDNGLFVAGFDEARRVLVLAECLWNGRQRTMPMSRWHIGKHNPDPILLAADPGRWEPLLVYVVNQRPLESVKVKALDDFPNTLLHAGTPPWLPERALAVVKVREGTTWVLSTQPDGLLLHAFSSGGNPVASRMVAFTDQLVEWHDGQLPRLPIPFHVRAEATYVGLGKRLLILRPSDRTDCVSLPQPALSLAGSPPHSRCRIVATMADGAAICWDGSEPLVELVARDLQLSVAGFTRSGWLVIADAQECRLYRAENHRAYLEATLLGSGNVPLAVLACPHPDQFALVQSRGIVQTYRLSRR